MRQAQQQCNRNYNQGGDYALDYLYSTARVVGSRLCQRLCNRRIYSPASGDRRGCTAHSVDPRTKINLREQQLEYLMRLNSTMLIGLVLIVIGIVALAYQGITYTTREKILDVGPLEATAERQKTIPLPPIVGGAALAGGLLMIVAGAKKS
jgi:hypothetical protein